MMVGKLFRYWRSFCREWETRIITFYTQLTSLKKGPCETITDSALMAETKANALRNAKEHVGDGFLVAMILIGLPDEYKACVTVTTQSDTVPNENMHLGTVTFDSQYRVVMSMRKFTSTVLQNSAQTSYFREDIVIDYICSVSTPLNTPFAR